VTVCSERAVSEQNENALKGLYSLALARFSLVFLDHVLQERGLLLSSRFRSSAAAVNRARAGAAAPLFPRYHLS